MDKIDKLLRIMRYLKQAPNNGKRQVLLRKYKTYQDLQDTLFYTYNPYFKYGITENNWSDELYPEYRNDKEYETIFDILDLLRTNNINDEYRKITYDFINKQEPEVKDLYKKMLFKDLDVGVGVKTINSVFSGLIPEFNVQLAHNYSDYVAFCHNRRCTVTEKLDGHRAIIMKHKGVTTIFTRGGKAMTNVDYIIEDAKNLPDDYVYDGELLPLNIETKGREYQQISKILKSHYPTEKAVFHMFDVIPVEDFRRQQCDIKYGDRKALLKTFEDTTYIKKINFLFEGIFNKFQLDYIYKTKVADLSEGLMINFDNGMYEFKRTKSLLKVKNFDVIDCIVTGIERGRGKNAKILKSITIRFEHNGQQYFCKCGSGFSQDERVRYGANETKIVGKVVEIQYFDITLNDSGEYSLRFPVFKRIREEI